MEFVQFKVFVDQEQWKEKAELYIQSADAKKLIDECSQQDLEMNEALKEFEQRKREKLEVDKEFEKVKKGLLLMKKQIGDLKVFKDTLKVAEI